MFHHTEAHLFQPLTADDYEQYEALYPDGQKMDPAFLVDWYDPEECEDEDRAASNAGAALQRDDEGAHTDDEDVLHEDELQHREPFARPCNPTPCKAATKPCIFADEDETTLFRPRVLFPSARTTLAQETTRGGDTDKMFGVIPPPFPPPSDESATSSSASPENYDDDFVFTPSPSSSPSPTGSASPSPAPAVAYPPSSPYRVRHSPLSWTGLDEVEWGHDYYLDCAGTMGVRNEWEAATGVSHGMLQRCRWIGYAAADRKWIAPAAAGVELTLTTPEGEEYWLDDCVEQYEKPTGPVGQEYGHRCGEACIGFFESFGWELFPEEQDVGARLVAALDLAGEGASEGESEAEDVEDEDCQGEMYPRWTMLETVLEEEDEDEVDGEDGDEEMSEVDFDMGFLDRLADVVLAESSRLKENAVEESKTREDERKEKEVPLWERDPTYVSGMSWADMMDEDEEY